MSWTPLDTWIVTAGVLAGAACALPGCFLLLRRMSMMGDAISHAVLPGLAVAFLLSGSRASVGMFVGAAAAGVFTALATDLLNRYGRVEEGAAMGVVFTALFALGLILIVRAADTVDLDPGCVLYGAIELTPLDTVAVAGRPVPRAALTLGGALVLNVLFTAVFYKELKLTSFDEGLAGSLGIHPGLMRHLLMVVVALTTVAAFESVGSILVIAMLVVPGAAARLLTNRLPVMLVLSVLLAAGGAVLGHLGAITVPGWFGFPDTSTAGMMAVALGALFTLALLFAPGQGLVSRGVRRVRAALETTADDLLGLLYRLEEAGVEQPAPRVRAMLGEAGLAGPLASRLAAAGLRRNGRLACRDGALRLTGEGRQYAARLVRSHRLWETYLHKHLGLAPDHLHATAERLEHVTTPDLQDRLARRVDRPDRDPHGRSIPE